MFPSTLFTGSSTNIQLSPSSSIAFWCSSSVSRRGWTSDHPPSQGSRTGSWSFSSSELVSLPVCCCTILSPLYAHCQSICPSLCSPSALGSKLLSSGPTSQSVSVVFVWVSGRYLVAAVAPRFGNPQNASLIDHGGPLNASVSAKLPSILGCWWQCQIPPPCLGAQKNEMIGGGDIHESLLSLSFSRSIFAYLPPQRPRFALEQKRNTFAWWYLVARRL
jgi:hypothetical protein